MPDNHTDANPKPTTFGQDSPHPGEPDVDSEVEGSATSGLPEVTKILAAVVAQTTLVTSLLYYFGWMHAYWFFGYFGVNSTLLGLGSVDFVMRSADALFVPMIVFAFAGLILLWLHAALRAQLGDGLRSSVVPRLVPAAAVIGLVLALAGLLTVFTPTILDRRIALAPLCLGSGIVLLLYAVRLRRAMAAPDRGKTSVGSPKWLPIAEWTGVFVVVALSLFWAATDYSSAVGRAQGRQYAAGLPREPDAVIYSQRSLRLHAPGVREVRCEGPEATALYRYDGLKLMIQSGDQYVFIPERWSRATGVTFIIPRSDMLRLEFRPATGAAPPSVC
jgi:hypothetical protein